MCCLFIISLSFLGLNQVFSAENSRITDEAFFTLENGINLRHYGGKSIRALLIQNKGQGKNFGATQRKRYCRLKYAR